MFAAAVEAVGVNTGVIGALQSLTQLDVEHLEAQAAGGIAVFDGFGEAQPVAADFGVGGACSVVGK